MPVNTLILEPDKEISAQIHRVARSVECDIVGLASNTDEACYIAHNNPIDLLVGDILSEKESESIQRCRALQSQQHFSIILVTDTVESQILEKLAFLEFVGYLTKPINEENLKVLIFIAKFRKSTQKTQERYSFDDTYTYCFVCATLFRDENSVEMTLREHRLILALIESDGELLPYDVMEHKVWQGEQISLATRRQFIHRFRSKVPYFPLRLVKGLGYRIG